MPLLSGKTVTHRLHVRLEQRRGASFDLRRVLEETGYTPDARAIAALDDLWVFYRTLCGVMYAFVPSSGHPGGSLSAGRIVLGLLFESLACDLERPDADDADRLIFAAGHKALGLYAAWALRDELQRIATGVELPRARRLRWEDLLGFRRNRTQDTPLFRAFSAKPLDGHPTPFIPFVPVATGPSGVGIGSSFGYALGLLDYYGLENAPRVHVLEGEGGLTPGRVHEALAAAATIGISNLVLHVDWNQSSIDSDRVCREGEEPGDYVQWDPVELGVLHDWNVIRVERGLDQGDILAAQVLALEQTSGQPTMVVYRTIKGCEYGLEGRRSHGSGHALESPEYAAHVLEPFEARFGVTLPRPEPGLDDVRGEQVYWDTLSAIRRALEADGDLVAYAGDRLAAAARRLKAANRRPRRGGPDLPALTSSRERDPASPPAPLRYGPGTSLTLREALGNALAELNRISCGALLGASADLLGSTSLSRMNRGFPGGFYHPVRNPGSRLVAIGGICEDAMGGFMTGVSAAGHHIGVSSSYGAFIAALQHIAARVHAIGQQGLEEATGRPFCPYIMVNGHAGIKTGEDGPTHADPQPLQLLQENFPRGTCITLVPWEPLEVWPLLVAALARRPAVIAPFVTRPGETVPDRSAQGLAPPEAAVDGVYRLVSADPARRRDGTVVLQGSEVTLAFVRDVLPRLREDGVELDVFYIASAELFDGLPEAEQARIFPEDQALEAMGITGFTLPVLYRWVTSRAGRRFSLYPFKGGRFLSSGKAHKVMQEAGLDGRSILRGIRAYLSARKA